MKTDPENELVRDEQIKLRQKLDSEIRLNKKLSR